MSSVGSERPVTGSAAVGRRERKKLATRDRIFECGLGLFASRGYDSTTMDDIADCADVSRATVFNYFARKEDVVFEWYVRKRPKVVEILDDAKQKKTDTAGRVRHVCGRIAGFYEDDPATGRSVIRAWLRAGGPLLEYTWATSTALAEIIRLGQEQGDVASDLDATRAGLVISDAFVGVLYRWVSDETFTLQENLMPMLDIVLTGIVREPF